MTLVFDPWPSLLVLGGFGLVAALVAVASLLRNWRSGIFRTLGLAAIIALLANPQWREGERTKLDDIAIVLVDETASQTLAERSALTKQTADALATQLSAMDGVETRILPITGEDETRVIETLQSALSETPRSRLGAAFIVTDGQSADYKESIVGLDAPVHVIVPARGQEIDRKITLTNAPRYGIVDQAVRVSFRVDDLGIDEAPINGAADVNVTLRVDGEAVLTQPVPLGAEAGFDAPLSRPGETVIELEVEPRNGELTEKNNIAVLPISAIRDRLRVLLISGEPHPGERVWRNLLKSDPAVDLVHFTILRPTDKDDNTPNKELALIIFPQNELFIEKLPEFDLIIFDRYTYRDVLNSFHFDNIARYVEQGGAVLIAAGPEYIGARSLAARRNLSFILPARPAGPSVEEPFRPKVTDMGARHPVTAKLSESDYWGRWMRIIPVVQRSGRALMSGPDDAPLLILDRVQEGRVGLLLSDHVWLWARGFDGGGPHAELLRRIAHWLMKEPELEEEALSLTEENGDLVVRRRTVESQTDPVEIELPDGSIQMLDMREEDAGRFAARITDAPRGLYRARAGQLFAIGVVGLAAAPEFQDVVSTTAKLAPLAEQTGGGVFKVSAARELPSLRRVSANADWSGERWSGIVKRGAARIETVRDRPAAPKIIWLTIITIALMMAWLIESGRLRRNETVSSP